ncbi:hypothetical protein BGZ93_000373 [Podila epicladia]|nr:hypothetical protein BGZ92_009244 [Podila epicladia]KAG0098355.1 hypothetical protein BGZ93_000373 [Podila epicladia]
MATLSKPKPSRRSWIPLVLCCAALTFLQASALPVETTGPVTPLNIAAAPSRGSKPTSILLKGGTIIAYDDQKHDLDIIRDGSLLIVNDRIAAIGKDIGDVPAGTEIVDVAGGIITPGFVDTHKHSWQHLYQTMEPDITLGEYVWKYSSTAKITMHLDVQDVYSSTKMSLMDSLNGGVTSILDHGHATFTPKHIEGMMNATIESGARVWQAYTVTPVQSRKDDKFKLDYTGVNRNGWRWKQLQALAKQAPWADGRVQLGLAWEFGRTAQEARYGFEQARDLNLSVVTVHHVGFPIQPDSGYMAKPIYQLNEWGFLNSTYPIVFSHGTLVDGGDLSLLRKNNHFVSVTPESEHHFVHGQLFAHRVLTQGALGTDVSATFSSDMITQMRLQLQSTRNLLANPVHYNMRYANNTAMTVKQAFLLGTRNGGLALHRPDIGVLKKGAKADVVVFSSDNPAFSAFYDPVAAVVLHSHVGHIQHVLVDGRWVKRDFKLQGVDWPKIKADFEVAARKIQKISDNEDWAAVRKETWSALHVTDDMEEAVPRVNVDPSQL